MIAEAVAHMEQLEKEKKAEQRVEESGAMQSLRAKLRQRKLDPFAHIEFGDRAMSLGARSEATSAYFNAIALGIPNLRESAMARWKWASWRKAEQRHPLSAGGEELNQVRQADAELRRHIRSSPDDVEALETLILIVGALGKNPSELNGQLARAKARLKLKGGTPAHAASVTKDRTGLSFESRCLELVSTLGFRAENTQVTADGGIDILAFSDQPLTAGKYVIQCKDWENQVGEPPLRDLLGVVHAEDAVKGILITSGTFTQGARRFAEGKRLDLIDGDDLQRIEATVGKDTAS